MRSSPPNPLSPKLYNQTPMTLLHSFVTVMVWSNWVSGWEMIWVMKWSNNEPKPISFTYGRLPPQPLLWCSWSCVVIVEVGGDVGSGWEHRTARWRRVNDWGKWAGGGDGGDDDDVVVVLNKLGNGTGYPPSTILHLVIKLRWWWVGSLVMMSRMGCWWWGRCSGGCGLMVMLTTMIDPFARVDRPSPLPHSTPPLPRHQYHKFHM